MKDNTKFDFQDVLYEFPYHYLPLLNGGKFFQLHRQLTWGLEYITYISFVADLINENHPLTLLDVGCGDGRLIYMVKSLVPRISGIDLSERATAFARAFNPDIEIACDEVATISRKYDWVTLIEVLEHIPDDQMRLYVRNIARVMKDDGRLLISVPTVNVPTDRKHYRHYDFDLLRDTIAPSFEVEKHWWLYRRGSLERFIRFILCNRFFVLNSSPLLVLLWRFHKRMTYYADASSGTHLVCLARIVKSKPRMRMQSKTVNNGVKIRQEKGGKF